MRGGLCRSNLLAAQETKKLMTNLKVMSSPKQVDIAITGKCNLACQYCFYADEMVARTNLPTERWLSFFEELGSLGVMTVCLNRWRGLYPP